MIKKIAITGPESTGKSTITKNLAKFYKEPYVEEYARCYLKNKGLRYCQSDLLQIAKGQIIAEENKIAEAKKLIFVDTELINIKIWSLHKYGNCDQWILDRINKQNNSLYLLCDIDMPWESDPLRENPGLREYFMEWFVKELEGYGFPYKIINGDADERLEKAIIEVNKII